MSERAGYYRLKADGSEDSFDFEVPDGSVMKMIEAMKALPKPQPYVLVNPKMYAMLKGK